MTAGVEHSSWLAARFGKHAIALRELIPRALATAVNRQIYTHLASGLESMHAFGGAWPAVYEELTNHVAGLDGAQVIRPRGKSFHLVMIDRALIVPFRYSNDLSTTVTDSRVGHGLNKTSQGLLGAFGSARHEIQGELFSVETVHGGSTHCGSTLLDDVQPTHVVLVPFAANARAGLLAAGLGEAALTAGGALRWEHYEDLTLPDPARAGSGRERATLTMPGRDPELRRFYEAPLPDPSLSPRLPGGRRESGGQMSEQTERVPLADDA